MEINTSLSYEVLERIARHCPEALCTYLHCINRANEQGSVTFSREMVEVSMSEKWTKFCNQIKKLALENLLEWHPFNGGIAVTMADDDE
jgi:hypothetical protein